MKQFSHLCFYFLCILLTACSSVPIQKTEPEKLTVDVDLVQSRDSVTLDAYVVYGIWQQAVELSKPYAETSFENGDIEQLIPANKAGRYGWRRNNLSAPLDLAIDGIGQVDFPNMQSVSISGRDQFEGKLFNDDDVLEIELPNSLAEERVLIMSGQCGSVSYTAEKSIPVNAQTLSISLNEIKLRINQAAESDLNGVIPVSFAIEDRYFPNWPKPFNPRRIASRDETFFKIDTSGFRFQAKVNVQVSNNLFLSLMNQSYPTKYCL